MLWLCRSIVLPELVRTVQGCSTKVTPGRRMIDSLRERLPSGLSGCILLNFGCAADGANPEVFVYARSQKWRTPYNLFLMDYLLKTEPTVYSFADLQKAGSTIWDGVTNPVAVRHLREMKPGERLVIYHTGDEKKAIGTASVISVDVPDPKNPQVKIKVGKAVAHPKALAEIKANRLFADSPLVRQGRLSVVPLTDAQYKFLTE